jgi:GTP pyrophosphokinase
MQRKNTTLEQLSDIIAFRVMVDSIGQCYAALGVIHSRYAVVPGRFKDYISIPKGNGYQSLHTTIIGPGNHKIEIQIRTREMHEVAELGVAAHWVYKQGEGSTDGRQYRWLRELLDLLEQTHDPQEFLEHTKIAMFQDQVFCFTPKGDLVSLPRGATPSRLRAILSPSRAGQRRWILPMPSIPGWAMPAPGRGSMAGLYRLRPPCKTAIR